MKIWSTAQQRLRAAAAIVAGFVIGAVPLSASAEWGLNLPRGVTPFSNTVYDLHMMILWICVGIGIVVFGAMFYSMWKFRKSQGAVAAK